MSKKNIFLILSISIIQASLASEIEQPPTEVSTETNYLRKYYAEKIAPTIPLIKKVISGAISGGISGFLSSYAYNQLQLNYPNSGFLVKTQLVPIFLVERITRFIANTFIAGHYTKGDTRQGQERFVTGRVAQISSWIGFLYGLMR